jgi:hypothetical protein
MGVILGVGVNREPVVKGYLHGQVWNRPIAKSVEQLCFKVNHSYEGTAAFTYAHTCDFYSDLFEAGYYTSDTSVFPLSLPWQAQSALVYTPWFSESALTVGDTQVVAPVASYAEIRGYESIPVFYAAGIGEPLDALWTAGDSAILGDYENTLGCSGGNRVTNLFLSVDSLNRLGFRYFAVEFLAKVGANNNEDPLLTTNLATISAGICRSVQVAAPESEDLFDPFVEQEFAAKNDDRQFSRLNPDTGDLEFVSVYTFFYSVNDPTESQWVDAGTYAGYNID